MFDGINFGGQSSGNPFDTLNKLLESSDIDIKTDLSMKQIEILAQISIRQKVMENSRSENPKQFILLVSEVLEEIKVYMCSFDRKSRGEITDTMKKMLETVETDSALGSLLTTVNKK